jgi:hypothetical protein
MAEKASLRARLVLLNLVLVGVPDLRSSSRLDEHGWIWLELPSG